MRRCALLAVAALGVLALTGCSPGAGPLDGQFGDGTSCAPTSDGTQAIFSQPLTNSTKTSLSIDSVTVVGAENVSLRAARISPTVSIPLTTSDVGAPSLIGLHVQPYTATAGATVEIVASGALRNRVKQASADAMKVDYTSQGRHYEVVTRTKFILSPNGCG